MIRLWLWCREVLSLGVLGVVYFGLFTPVAMVTRWLRADPLQRRFDADADSYLSPCEEAPPEGLWALLWARGKWWLVPVLVVLLLAGVLVAASELSMGLVFLYPLF